MEDIEVVETSQMDIDASQVGEGLFYLSQTEGSSPYLSGDTDLKSVEVCSVSDDQERQNLILLQRAIDMPDSIHSKLPLEYSAQNAPEAGISNHDDTLEEDVQPLIMFEERFQDTQHTNFLIAELYLKYKCSYEDPLAALTGILNYYFADYFNILDHLSTSSENIATIGYIERFQKEVNFSLRSNSQKMARQTSFFSLEKENITRSSSDIASTSLNTAMVQLESSLHCLMEERLEDYINYLLCYISTPDTTELDISNLAKQTKIISCVFQTIQGWKDQIEKLTDLPCPSSATPLGAGRQYEISKRFNAEMLNPLKNKIEQFLNISQSMPDVSKSDCSKLKQALQVYKDALDAIKVLKEIEGVALTEVLSKFNDEQAKFLSCCKSFLETKSNELFEAFEICYTAAKDNKQYALFEAGSWWFIYKDLQKIIGIWDEFTELYNAEASLLEGLCEQYKKHAQQFEQCQSQARLFIHSLFSFLKSIQNKHPVYPPSNVAKEAFIVLKRLREPLVAKRSIQRKDSVFDNELFDERYQEKFQKTEDQFHIYCSRVYLFYQNIQSGNNKKEPLYKISKNYSDSPRELIKQNQRYNVAKRFFQTTNWERGQQVFMKLCQGYFGDKWVDSNQHATAETALFASVSRLR